MKCLECGIDLEDIDKRTVIAVGDKLYKFCSRNCAKTHFRTNKEDALVAMNSVFSKSYIESIWGTNRFDDALDYWMALNAFSYVLN